MHALAYWDAYIHTFMYICTVHTSIHTFMHMYHTYLPHIHTYLPYIIHHHHHPHPHPHHHHTHTYIHIPYTIPHLYSVQHAFHPVHQHISNHASGPLLCRCTCALFGGRAVKCDSSACRPHKITTISRQILLYFNTKCSCGAKLTTHWY